jgi:hypothetical protein
VEISIASTLCNKWNKGCTQQKKAKNYKEEKSYYSDPFLERAITSASP